MWRMPGAYVSATVTPRVVLLDGLVLFSYSSTCRSTVSPLGTFLVVHVSTMSESQSALTGQPFNLNGSC